MRLVLRRAGEAKGLLLAAGVATLVASAMVTGLTVYNRQALDAGKHSVLDSASAEERSLLISAAIGAAEGDYADRDAAVRAAFADGLAGLPVTVTTVRAGTGRQLTGDLGGFTPAGDQLVFASMVTLPGLADRAELRVGEWPRPGGRPLQVALPEQVAAKLGVGVGERIPLTDRATDRRGEVQVVGLWQPFDPADPYWRLTPELAAADTTIGPFVLDPADFARVFPGGTSAAWLVEPDLDEASPTQIAAAGRAAAALDGQLAEQAGLGTSAQVATRLDRLGGRLVRADLVGRSALLTPVLLVVVLGGYALLLVATLLAEDRRSQIALLRARGAARHQIAGLAAREAALVVVPVAVLAPPLVGEAMRYADRISGLAVLDLEPRPTSLSWLVALLVAAGCLLALLGPALRRSGTYIEDLGARSRPSRWAAAQRASMDIALVGVAVLAWAQLRQYSSPLAGGLSGIDPLLVTAPALGVLGGTVIALRLLPLATRLAERLVSGRTWTATILGMWQAGRRPHAGPVLLLALAVGGSALAWSLVSTWERSLVDQADHRVGADLRIVERAWPVPSGRAAQLAALPGVRTVLPAWHDDIRIGADAAPATAVALDAAAAADLVRLHPSLVDGAPVEMFERLAAGRLAAPGTDLPAGTTRLTGSVSTPAVAETSRTVSTELLLSTPDGQIYRVPMATTDSRGGSRNFTVDLPDTGGRPVRIAGFRVDTVAVETKRYGLRVADLRAVRADGSETAVDLGPGQWTLVDAGARRYPVTMSAGTIDGTYVYPEPLAFFFGPPRISFTAIRSQAAAAVPAVVTPEVLRELRVQVGQTAALPLPGRAVTIRIVGVVDAVPTLDGGTPGVLLDLPSAATDLLHTAGQVRPVPQWFVNTEPGRHTAAGQAADRLAGVTVLDRVAEADRSERDPYVVGARTGLLVAALGAILLALVGLGVDVWATARRRLGELAVLHTLGAAPRLLARALLAEQVFLAGIGVVVGLLVGGSVGATLAPLVILTPSADRPVPVPVFDPAWWPVAATGGGLLVVAMALSGSVALTIRRRVAAEQLRIGADR